MSQVVAKIFPRVERSINFEQIMTTFGVFQHAPPLRYFIRKLVKHRMLCVNIILSCLLRF